MALSPNILPTIVTYSLIVAGGVSVFFVFRHPTESLVNGVGKLSRSITRWTKYVLDQYRPVEIPGSVRHVMGIGIDDELNLPPWLARWSATVGPKLRKSGMHINATKYLVFVVVSSLTGFLFGMVFLHNFTFAIALAVGAYIIPDQVIMGRGQKMQNKYIEQLSMAVRVLHAELQDYPNIQSAFTNMARKIPLPLGKLFEDASLELSAGQEPQSVFAKLMDKLQFDYGRTFVQLIMAAWYDTSVYPSFISLSSKLHSQRTLIIENQKKLHSERAIGIGINVFCAALYLYGQRYPIAREYFQYTFLGKLTVTMWMVSVILGMVMERMFGVVD